MDERERIEAELILRDHLAVARTVIANERTLLAYIRTALTVLAAGVTLVKFGGTAPLQGAGWAFLPVGLGMFGVGIWRYFAVRRQVRELEAYGRPLWRE